jgi:phosphoglycolate phosphatase-like HAD superfamily hydrolase
MCDYEVLNKDQNIIFNKKAQDLIKNLNVVIFDCDGVLLKTDVSYDRAICDTIDLFFSNIFNKKIENLISSEDILLIRNTGGFNNDWELTYAFILYYFYQISTYISKKQLIILPKTNKVTESFENLSKLLELIGLKNLEFEKIYHPKENDIKEYISYLDIAGLRTSRKVLYSWTENLAQIQFLQKIEEFMKFNMGLDQDIITRIFQELYLGPLITKFYGFDQIINNKRGYIENETLNGKIKDYKNLIKMGINKFGIATSRPRKEAKYVLEKVGIIPKMVNEDSLVFLEEIKSEEENIYQKIEKRISLEKPDPYSIIRSLREFEGAKVAAYIGDTVADIYATKSANKKLDYPLISIGYTGLSTNKKLLELKFKNIKADIIIPSIKELLTLIKEFK